MHVFPELTRAANENDSTQSFWKRQVFGRRTHGQIVFDLMFGVCAPLACFIFDPIVFQGGIAGPPLFASYQPVVYLFSGIEIVLLCFWLLLAGGPELANAMIGSALLVGGVFCLVIGIALFPYTLMGLLVGIGIFGFIPFLTAAVYGRNGFRALRTNANPHSSLTRSFGFLCGAFLVMGVSAMGAWWIQTTAARSVDQILRGDGDPIHTKYAVRQLAVLRFFTNAELNRIVEAYVSETNTERKAMLRSCYREISGEDIELRARILAD
jgi:cytochrome bd-type quinol oxidase subunit 2